MARSVCWFLVAALDVVVVVGELVEEGYVWQWCSMGLGVRGAWVLEMVGMGL